MHVQEDRTRKEIISLVREKRYEILRQLLCERLSFGTAGIRGVMRAGFACMNDLVIIQTSQGLAKYVEQHFGAPLARDRGVVIGFDARHNSRRFAERAAVSFLQLQIPVYLFSDIVPTPFIPFGIKCLQAIAGITITASHNPKQDNGYKVFFQNGSQIVSPHDKHIQSLILQNLQPWPQAWQAIDLVLTDPSLLTGDASRSSRPLLVDPLDRVSSEYYSEIRKRIHDPELIARTDIKFTFTALHGVGHKYMSAAFAACNFPAYHPVPEQMLPDPVFPTVRFPNPEEGKGVLDLSIATANSTGSQVILANDPDADRCALAERQSNGSWKIFTGNEIGTLLGWWLWLRHQKEQKEKKRNPNASPSADAAADMIRNDDCYMLSSAVSSKILSSIAREEGFHFIETLTGFKWMGNRAEELLNDGKKVIFAFEEAIGFMCGSTVLDKDGITAGIEIAQMAAYVRSVHSSNLTDHLKYIFNRYGYHASRNSYFICHEKKVIDGIFHRLAHHHHGEEGGGGRSKSYPKMIGSHRINRVRDLHHAFDSGIDGNVPVSADHLSMKEQWAGGRAAAWQQSALPAAPAFRRCFHVYVRPLFPFIPFIFMMMMTISHH
jgi:phosphoglucomutase/phosphopentomutase